MAPLPRGYSKIGDDVAVIPIRGRKLVLKADMLVQRTDIPKGMTFRQAARKAVAMCVSDFAAKGVKPDSFLVSLGISRGTSASRIEELGFGLRDAARKWGVKLVGGDTSEADQLIVGCMMAGFTESLIGRGGAEPEDLVVTTGYFGYPPAGLKILLGRAKASIPLRRRAIGSVLMPTPNLRLGLALAPRLSASMDSSDGLGRSLHVLSMMSDVGMEITQLPTGPGIEGFARANHLSARDLVLQGGEEYLIVGTIKKRRFQQARRVAKLNGGELMAIGKVTNHVGKVVLRTQGTREAIEDSGWVHLR